MVSFITPLFRSLATGNTFLAHVLKMAWVALADEFASCETFQLDFGRYFLSVMFWCPELNVPHAERQNFREERPRNE